MTAPQAFAASAILASALLTAPAFPQTAPAGACLLPTGEWCWPIAPLTYGDPCVCPLPDGTTGEGFVE